MSWSYLAGSGSSRDRVRFKLGDTNAADQLLQDEEIDDLIVEHVNVLLAAAHGAEAIASRLARDATLIQVADVSESYSPLSAKSAYYGKLAEKLFADARREMAGIGMPHLGGSSRDRKAAVEEDTDRVSPAFTRGDPIGELDLGHPV